jgi:hypothetical protein
MERQPRLALARLRRVEGVEVRMPGDELGLVGLHGLDEVDHDVVRHVGADADDEVDGLHFRRLVDTADVGCRIHGREVVLGSDVLHALLGVRQDVHREHAQAADCGRDLLHLRRTDGEEEDVDPVRLEVLRSADDVDGGHVLHVLQCQAARGEERVQVRDDARLLDPVGRNVSALEIGERLDRRVLAHPECHLESVEAHREPDVRLRVALPDVLALHRLGRLADVEQEEVRLLGVHCVDDSAIAAVSDHAHLELRVVLHHLRDHRGLRVEQRARLQRREANRLLGECGRRDKRGSKAAQRFEMHVSPLQEWR